MPRRLVVKRQDIYRRRAESWKQHFDRRALAQELVKTGLSAEQVVLDLKYYYPRPEIGIDGYLLDYPKREVSFNRRVPESLRCYWYWGFNEWMEFVRLYQSLPEVYEDYYWRYQRKEDRVVLSPMSSKPKWGSKKVQVPDFPLNSSFQPVDKPVDNLGTSRSKKVQVWSNPQ